MTLDCVQNSDSAGQSDPVVDLAESLGTPSRSAVGPNTSRLVGQESLDHAPREVG
jgi:hypothetical protein